MEHNIINWNMIGILFSITFLRNMTNDIVTTQGSVWLLASTKPVPQHLMKTDESIQTIRSYPPSIDVDRSKVKFNILINI